MPPPIPVHVLDFKERARPNIGATRAGAYFAEFKIPKKLFKESEIAEFGEVVYGPARLNLHEAEDDLRMIAEGSSRGSSRLRRVIAKLGAAGGTRSLPNPSVIPVLAHLNPINASVSCDDCVQVKGVRRQNVSVWVPSDSPIFLIARVIDIVTDLLACVVDSQLNIAPPTSELVAVVKYAISRETCTFPLSEEVWMSRIVPVVGALSLLSPWTALSQPNPDTDDLDVIRGLLNQLLDKSRRADIYGERKQLKKCRKEVRERRKAAHTLFVSNLPADVTEEQLFSLFNSSLPNITNPVYKVKLPRDQASGVARSYAFVTCRSAKATKAIFEFNQWVLGGKKLYLAARDYGEDSPSQKRQKIDSSAIPTIPQEVVTLLRTIIEKHPGCNISQIPTLAHDLSPEISTDAQKYGYRSLTYLLESIQDIRLEQVVTPNSFRPIYRAYSRKDHKT